MDSFRTPLTLRRVALPGPKGHPHQWMYRVFKLRDSPRPGRSQPLALIVPGARGRWLLRTNAGEVLEYASVAEARRELWLYVIWA